MIPGAGAKRNLRAGNWFYPETLTVAMTSGTIFPGGDHRARVEWVNRGAWHTELEKVSSLRVLQTLPHPVCKHLIKFCVPGASLNSPKPQGVVKLLNFLHFGRGLVRLAG